MVFRDTVFLASKGSGSGQSGKKRGRSDSLKITISNPRTKGLAGDGSKRRRPDPPAVRVTTKPSEPLHTRGRGFKNMDHNNFCVVVAYFDLPSFANFHSVCVCVLCRKPICMLQVCSFVCEDMRKARRGFFKELFVVVKDTATFVRPDVREWAQCMCDIMPMVFDILQTNHGSKLQYVWAVRLFRQYRSIQAQANVVKITQPHAGMCARACFNLDVVEQPRCTLRHQPKESLVPFAAHSSRSGL